MSKKVTAPTSNTAANSASTESPAPEKKKAFGKPFEKGDPRINRHGRPKGYDDARKAAVAMLGEVMGVVEVTDPLTKEKRQVAVTRFQSILLDWITSRNFQKQKEALAIAGVLNKGDLPVQMNLDVRSLTNDQLDRIIKGENILDVLKKT